jgi:hypothetical protein
MSKVEEIIIKLTHDQALVLFEWLSREDNKLSLSTESQAEQNVLWNVEGQLERILVEPLEANYIALVAAARARMLSEDGGTETPDKASATPGFKAQK